MWTEKARGLNHATGGAWVLGLDVYEARGGFGRPQAWSSRLWRRGRDNSARYVRLAVRVTYLVITPSRYPIYGYAVWHKVRI